MSNQNQEFETQNQEIESLENQQNQKNEESIDDNGTPVKYTTHKKLLNQYKSKMSELEELKRFKEETEEQQARKKGDYEALIKARDEKLKEYESKLSTYEKNIVEGQKLSAFMRELPGEIKKQEYLSFVDIDQIALDPETNRVDETTLKKVVSDFVQNYGDLIAPKNKNGLPKVNNLGGGPNTKQSLRDLSREELVAAFKAGKFEN